MNPITLPGSPEQQVARPSSKGKASDLGTGLQSLVYLTLFLLLWLSVLAFPQWSVTPNLDLSWMASCGYFFKNHFRAGVDYTFTMGPLGYFLCPCYDADLFWGKYLWELVVKFILVCTVFALTRQYPFALRTATVVLLLLLSSLIFFNMDVAYEFIVLVNLLGLISLPPHASSIRLWFKILLIVVLAQTKFTILAFSIASLLMTGGAWLLARRYARAVQLLAALAVCGTGTWLLLGQRLGDLPAYLANSLQVSAGYEAMALPGDPSEFWLCLSILALLAGSVILCRPTQFFSLRHLNAAAIVGMCLFMQWKHGFIRQDGGHVVPSLAMLALVGLALPPSFPGCNWKRPARVVTLSFAFLASVTGILLTTYKSYNPVQLVTAVYVSICQNGANILHPVQWRQHLEQGQAAQAALVDLPQVRAHVGDAPVDILSYEQGTLLLNRLHYRPRPVFQSYATYTPSLLALNAQFFRGASAPPFLLFKLQTIDNRFPFQDDCSALFEIFRRYQPILMEKDYLLLRKTDSRSGDNPPPQILRKEEIRLNEEVTLDEKDNEPVKISLDIRYHGRGKLQKLLYKLPPLLLRVRTSDNGVSTFRLIPDMVRNGILLSPFLRHNTDVIRLYGNGPLLRVVSFCLVADPEAQRCYRAGVPMILERLPGLVGCPLEAGAYGRLSYPMFATYPVEVQTGFLFPAEVQGTPVLVVHADGWMRFEVPAEATELTGRFGILPAAYEQGCTDGVEFVVEYRPGHGDSQILFRRYLDPLHQVQDRGLQTLHISLPAEMGPGELLLKTTNLPGKNFNWDWSYWSGVRIR